MVRLNQIVESVDNTKILKIIAKYFLIEGSKPIIDDDGYVTIEGNLAFHSYLGDTPVTRLPVTFLQVSGDVNFDTVGSKLTSLIGSPRNVGKDFDCSRNDLTSLEGGPQNVGSFYCSYNRLTSLEGLPTTVYREIHCEDNPLQSLKGLSDSFNGIILLTWSKDLPLLRLLRCNTIYFANHDDAADILMKYAGKPSRANILACQKELIQNGFEGNASW